MPPKGKVRWLSPAEQAAKDAANKQTIDQSINQLMQIFHGQIDDNVIQLVFQSNNQSFDQSMDVLSQMVEDTPKEVRQSINQPTKQTIKPSSSQSVNVSSQWTHGSINQPKQSTNQSVALDSSALWPSLPADNNSSNTQSINQSNSQSSKPIRIHQSTNKPISQSTKSTVNQPVNQSVNQSIKASQASDSFESIWDPPTTKSPTSQSTKQSVSLPSPKTMKQSKTNAISPPVDQSLNQPINASDPIYTIRVLDPDSDFSESELADHLITNRSNKLSIKPSANQPVNRSTKQSTNPTYQTITNGELDPMDYLLFVNQSINQMRTQSDQRVAVDLQRKLDMQPITQSTEQSSNQSTVTFPELSLEQLKLNETSYSKPIHHSSGQSSHQSIKQSTSQSINMDREGLLELLCLMFDSIDRSLIDSLLDSIDQSNVQSLNEVVETLTSITAEEQLLRDDESDEQSEYPSINQSTNQSTSQSSTKLGSGDQKLELTDLEIAQRMASDPKWSPPRASRSLNRSTNQSANQSTNPSNKRFSKSKAVKLDMTKPVYAWPTNQPLGDQWKLKTIKQHFPTVEPDLIEEIFSINQSNYQLSINHLKELFPDECVLSADEMPPIIDQSTNQWNDAPVKPKRYSAASIASRVNRPSTNQSTNQSTDQVDDTDYEGESLIPDSVMEYEIGATLDNRAHHSNDSPFTRDDAAAHANRRALFFRAATACFHANRGAEAKRFAKLGHDEGSLIMETSVGSAAQIFRANNKDLDCNRKIDLHGLHVKEAICFLDFAIRRFRRRGGGGTLIAVTGRGMHSIGGKSKLKPAIQRFCERHRYRVSPINNAEMKIIFG